MKLLRKNNFKENRRNVMAVPSSEEHWNTKGFRLSNSHSRGLPSEERPGNVHLILKATYIEVKL